MALSAGKVIDQVRFILRRNEIKLWLEPYYFEEIGPIESELEILAKQIQQEIGISCTDCKIALIELQEGALQKLSSRKSQDNNDGLTLKARIVNASKCNVGKDIIELKYCATTTGDELFKSVSEKLECDVNELQIIISGKVLQREKTLFSQGIKNNLQAIILVNSVKVNSSNIYERVKKAKDDALFVLLSNDQQLITMEDQDGNLVDLPLEEKNALLLALALYEKGRSALNRSIFDEALVLFLESDEQFSASNSSILNNIDNYALLNLDIVWCYLCLKSLNYLPDAERRLKICEDNFKKSYGHNMQRVSTLRNNSIGNEEAHIMRFHLLQGVLCFHQNKLDEAFEKLLSVEEELKKLQIDEEKLDQMLSMGFKLSESKVALRACSNDLNMAVTYVQNKREKKEAMQKIHTNDNTLQNLQTLTNTELIDAKNVLKLAEMGFEADIAASALLKSGNSLFKAIDLIQNREGNQALVIPEVELNTTLLGNLTSLGFQKEMVNMALKYSNNNCEETIDFLLKLHYEDNLKNILEVIEKTEESEKQTAGTSSSCLDPTFLSTIKSKIVKNIEVKKAYNRFVDGVSTVEDDCFDNSFSKEWNILNEYKTLLMQ